LWSVKPGKVNQVSRLSLQFTTNSNLQSMWDRRDRDRMVVGISITYSVYHHWCCEFESRPGRGTTLCDKVCSNLRPVGGFLAVLRFPPPIKLIDITDILLKVVLNTIKPTKPNLNLCRLILCSFVFVLTCLHVQYFMRLCVLILYFFGWLLFNVKLALPLFLLYCWQDQACK
jgi:hypothetical protein